MRVAPAPHDSFLDLMPRQGVRLTPRHYAYLKISEGCDNRCAFCIDPQASRPLVSRPGRRSAARGGETGKAGVKELLVISQDTSAYGLDFATPQPVAGRQAARRAFLDLTRELALWAPGCACITSIPIRMSTRSSP